jgi:Fe-S oxidoreductase
MADGKLTEARKMLDRSMPLSGLTGLLCDGACMPHCRRAEVDAGVNIALIERACVTLTRAARPLPLPRTGKSVAVVGAGLSGLITAFELGKKGHSVTVFHNSPPGGRLLSPPGAISGRDAEALVRDALEQLAAVRVLFTAVTDFSPAFVQSLREEHLALYIGLDDPGLSALRHTPEPFPRQGKDPRETAPDGFDLAEGIVPLTRESADPKIFVGGAATDGRMSYLREAAEGKHAAGSITRLLQGVNPATAREGEALYPTSLYTDISGVSPLPPVVPADPAAPTREEAAAEAARCIRCECLECVKNCVYLAAYKAHPKRYAREIYNNLSIVHGLRRANTQIVSCAECGLCAAVCPNGADMGAFCAVARREMIRVGRMPPSAHEFALEDMAYSNAPDVAFFRHQPGHIASAWLFFPGCQLPASLPERTARLYSHLCAHLAGGVGLLSHCCGAPARWSGRNALTAATAASLRSLWEEAGRPVLLLACASCSTFFAAELPDIPTQSLWNTLAGLPLPDGAARTAGPLALHDPCAARDSPAVRDSVRDIVRSLGQEIEELPFGRELTRCCGYGGLAHAANPAMGDAYARDRADDTANILLTYCIMCRDRLRAVGKASLHLLDLLFAASPPDSAADRPAPGISGRQENRLAFRRHMLQSFWRESPDRNSPMDAISLRIDDAVARRLEARRILRSDIQAVLLHAEKHGAQFFNADAGRCLTSFRPKQVTFWVEFSQDPDGSYAVHDAYCHRMVVPGVPGEGLPTAVILEGHDPTGGRV